MERQDLMQEETFGNETGNDDVLLMLFDRLVREHGAVKAGELLGINYRTVAKVRATRRLTPYITNALEMFMLSEANPVIQGLVTKVDSLHGQVEKLRVRDKELSATVDKHQTETAATQEALLKMVRATARQVDKLGVSERKSSRSADGGDGDKKTASPKSGEKETQQTTKWFPRRTYPQLVTKVPAEDDEHVYKEAWPVVREWREVENGHRYKGKTLTWMKRHERLLEVERRLLDEFQLTLPPARHPIDKEMRRKLLRWNEDDLRSIRGRIVRRLMLRWVRRILTVGLWRK
ncbi:MAG: hypothetical protein F4X20_04790 [Dehalococcoidia bacterium]|nr:hypothetical protein [Dehalococcoidia bacterium]